MYFCSEHVLCRSIYSRNIVIRKNSWNQKIFSMTLAARMHVILLENVLFNFFGLNPLEHFALQSDRQVELGS